MAPRLNAANQAATTLDAAVASGDTSISVTDASVFPSAPFRATISDGSSDEIIEVGSVDTTNDNLDSLTRGLEDTTAQNWSLGDSVDQRFTAGTYSELADEYSAGNGISISSDTISVASPINTGTGNDFNIRIGSFDSSFNVVRDSDGSTKFSIPEGTNNDIQFNRHDLQLNSHKIKGVTDPDNAQEAATKNYVDNNTEADTRVDVSDSGGVVTSDTTDVQFTASGASTVSVSADGDGSATVDISSTDNDTQLTDSEVQTAINNDADHGSTASHNYFSGDYSDLTNVSITTGDLSFDTATQTELDNHIGVADAHHARYSDEEAQDAVGNAVSVSGSLSYTYDDANNQLELSATDTDTRTNVSDSGTEVVSNVTDINFNDGVTATEDLQPYQASGSTETSNNDIGDTADHPGSIRWNADGTKIFLADASSGVIRIGSPSTAYEVGSPNFSSTFDTSSETGSPLDFVFGDGGSKMYLCGNETNVFQYNLSTPYDLSTASFSGNSLSGSFVSLDIGDGGSTLVVSDSGNSQFAEYDLSTAWDITSASQVNTFVPSEFGNFNEPPGIEMSEDGTVMFIGEGTVNQSTVYKYSLSTAWDTTTYSYTGNSWNPSTSNSLEMFTFANGGKKGYVADYNSSFTTDVIRAYDTTSSDGSVSVDSEEPFSFVTGMTEWADGLSNEEIERMVLQSGESLIIDRIEVRQKGGGSSTSFSSRVGEEVLVRYNLDSASYTGTSISTQDSTPTGIVFNGDGSKLFEVGTNSDLIYEYSLI